MIILPLLAKTIVRFVVDAEILSVKLKQLRIKEVASLFGHKFLELRVERHIELGVLPIGGHTYRLRYLFMRMCFSHVSSL